MSWEAFANVAGDALGAIGSYFGAKETNKANEAIARQNLQYQKEFAQSGIQWKVQDAIAAGIHPLAALGAQTASFSPSQVGAADMSTPFERMGQSVGRALKAAGSKQERAEQDAAKSVRLENEQKGIENDILRQRLASEKALTSRARGAVGPPLPRPGPSRATLGEAVGDDALKQKAEDNPQTKVGKPFGYPLLHNPYFGDGQSFEDRYGESEIASTIKWLANTAADHGYTAQKWFWEPYVHDKLARRYPRWFK